LGRNETKETRSFVLKPSEVYFSLSTGGTRFLTLGVKRRVQSLLYGLSTNTIGKFPSTKLLMTLRIFIVDDSDRVRAAIKALLSSTSSKWLVCGESAGGDDAVKRAAEIMPDVILLDLSLSQVQGTALATRLRDAIPAATIVLMSAQDPKVMRQFADLLQIEHFVPKSNLGVELVTTLEDINRKKVRSA
jgi:CheY-like chemotaxis protein